MTKNAQIAAAIVSLQEIFVDSPSYLSLKAEFDRLVEIKSNEFTSGRFREARGIALVGESGSGKSTAMRRLLRTLPADFLPDLKPEACPVLSFSVPSPATLKFVGQHGLQAIGYPLTRDKTSQIIWDMFRAHLQSRQTAFVHLDEAQDLSIHQTPKEVQSVLNTLKSLMQNPQWPVGVILSGMPSLKAMINQDVQLARRLCPIEMPRLAAFSHTDEVQDIIGYYAKMAGVEIEPDVMSEAHVRRHIHAASGNFGLVIEFVIEALETVMRCDSSILAEEHFSSVFRRRSGCLDELNPFVAADFERIDAKLVLQSSIEALEPA